MRLSNSCSKVNKNWWESIADDVKSLAHFKNMPTLLKSAFELNAARFGSAPHQENSFAVTSSKKCSKCSLKTCGCSIIGACPHSSRKISLELGISS